MEKIDLKKNLKQFYKPSSKRVEVVDVPSFQFAMIDGSIEAGIPPTESVGFQQAIEALYGISYTLKFMSKSMQPTPIDFTVMALEGLWWVDSGEFNFERSEDWHYTLMILQPNHITQVMFMDALQQLQGKKDNPAIASPRWERFQEGLCLQTMHVGPYASEPETIEKMKKFARGHGYTYAGRHHEIYLGDPRRAKPENLRTVIRQPVHKS